MRLIRTTRVTRTIGGLALLLGLGACMDMDVINPNAPDRQRALAQPGDVESLLSTGFYRFWNGTQKYSPGLGLAVVANELTSPWANYAMLPLAELPRNQWDNSPTYPRRDFIVNAWDNLYLSLSNVAEALAAIDDGLALTDPDGRSQEPRARAFGKLSQGLSHGFLALMFDQAVILDETTDLEQGNLLPVPYDQVMAAAIGYLEEAIAIAEANSFALPGGETAWINGRPLTNTELAQWAHSIAARYLAAVARTPTERAAVDWERVIYHLDRGVQVDDGPEGDANLWWWAGGHRDDYWIRAAYDLIGPADTTGAYDEWRSTPYRDREPFLMATADRRIHGAGDPESPGKYVTFMGYEVPWADERGTYLQSYYYYSRYDYHKNTLRGLMPLFLEAEHDLLRAEALLRIGGQREQAIDLINETRVEVGELPPLSYDASDEVVWETLYYEKALEVASSIAGVVYFDRRGWGRLYCGTPLHFPVPGAELEVLEQPLYSFGGGGEGSANPADGCIE